jgi:hypothetical protein
MLLKVTGVATGAGGQGGTNRSGGTPTASRPIIGDDNRGRCIMCMIKHSIQGLPKFGDTTKIGTGHRFVG